MSDDPPTAGLPPGHLLRPMGTADTTVTAELHRRLLPNGLFPRLGSRFMRRWHATFLDTPTAVGLVVVHQDRVVAFVLASLDQRQYLQQTLRRHRVALMWRGLLGLLARPVVLLGFVRTRLRAYARHLLPTVRPRPTAPVTAGPEEHRTRVAVVHAVVTSEQARGRGCARVLLEAVLTAATAAGADHVALVTDVPGPPDGAPPTGAAAMYERLRWQPHGVRRQRDGRWIAEYRYPLRPRPMVSHHDRAQVRGLPERSA